MYSKMDPKIKTKWLKALRSDNYRQAKGRLWREVNYPHLENGNLEDTLHTFCCLGVLCNIRQPEVDYDLFLVSDSPNYIRTFPDYNVMEWAKLNQNAMDKLASMNDNGYRFPEIADWIEENL